MDLETKIKHVFSFCLKKYIFFHGAWSFGGFSAKISVGYKEFERFVRFHDSFQ